MPRASRGGGVEGGAPRSTSNSSCASSTDRQIGPRWSIVVLSGTTPSVGIAPSVGLKPTSPQAADGIRIEPPVSLPTEAYAIPAATDTADPPDDPPGERVGSSG